ncbi:MAG: hypothetical protein IJ682_03515, partial [Lachnospiraceae bacterium]|nr:hypothetical protein [Lachnospiraceae bacterium]
RLCHKRRACGRYLIECCVYIQFFATERWLICVGYKFSVIRCPYVSNLSPSHEVFESSIA